MSFVKGEMKMPSYSLGLDGEVLDEPLGLVKLEPGLLFIVISLRKLRIFMFRS